jgi:hypothetical protein
MIRICCGDYLLRVNFLLEVVLVGESHLPALIGIVGASDQGTSPTNLLPCRPWPEATRIA